MTNRNARYRAKRIAAGAKPVYLLLSSDAATEFDRRCNATGLSRWQLVEAWLLEKSPDNEESS